MKITVLGGSGAWPTAEQACSAFVVEHEGFTLLLDLGYATLPHLLRMMPAERVDAVLVSHGHPDHCADVNPLLRARALSDHPPPALPLYALPGALDKVLALDRPAMLGEASVVREFAPGEPLGIGPFSVQTRALPHWVPNAGVRVSAGDAVVAYTGDSGPSREVVALAEAADLLIADATYPEEVPPEAAEFLTSARQAGRQAAQAGVGSLLLTHLWPGTDPQAATEAAATEFGAHLAVARTGLTLEVTPDHRQ